MEPLKTGVYVPYDPVTDSGRFSTAETVMTRDSQATFVPPYAGVEPSDRNLPFQKPTVFEENAPTKILSEDALTFEDFDGWRRKRRRKRVLLVILFIALLAIVGAAGYLFGATGGDDENEDENNNPPAPGTPIITDSPTESPTDGNLLTESPTFQPSRSPTVPTLEPTPSPTPPPVDFCAQHGVSDTAMRELLRDNFEAAFIAGDVGQLFYSSRALVCLPERAWNLLDNEQRGRMSELTQGIRISNGLRAIHPDAFEEDLVRLHPRLNLFNNFLTELPNGVFRNFLSLDTLTLSGNPFVTLRNPIAADLPNLRVISMINMDDLVEFPEFVRFLPNVRTLSMFDCVSLSTANARAFESNTITQVLLRSGTTPVLNQLGLEGLADALGIDSAVISADEEQSFCDSFGSDNDDVVREFIAGAFDESVASSSATELVFSSYRDQVPCLPKDAFRLLNAEQKEVLGQFEGISFLNVGIQRIHQQAFDPILFREVNLLNLGRNQLTVLPNHVIEPFLSMTIFSLGANPIVTISNNIFRRETGAETLTLFSMSDCRELVNFPEIMLFMPNLVDLQLAGSTSLANFNSDAFRRVNLPGIRFIRLSADMPVVDDPGIEAMANELGISEAVFQVSG